MSEIDDKYSELGGKFSSMGTPLSLLDSDDWRS
jgi:hypothetical protein